MEDYYPVPAYAYSPSAVRPCKEELAGYAWDEDERDATITETGIRNKQFCFNMRHNNGFA